MFRRPPAHPVAMPPPAWHAAVRGNEDGVRLSVDVVPGADRTLFPAGYNRWRRRITVRVSAPPKEGEANQALIQAVAAFLAVPASRIRIAAGARSRQKALVVEGLGLEEVLRRLGEALDGP